MARRLSFDRVLFASIVLLTGLGIVIVYSASVGGSAIGDAPVLGLSALTKQLVALVAGVAAMIGAMWIDYRVLRRPVVVYGLMAAVAALLVLVLRAPALNGVQRWLFVAGFSIQPSEFAKPALVIFLAYQIDRKWDRINTPFVLIPSVLALSVISVLIILEPDFGTALVLIALAGVMLFLGGLAFRFVFLAGLLLAPALGIVVATSSYRLARLTAFIDPERDPLGQGYQLHQSLIAVGSGGLLGRGLGQGGQKLDFLPMANSDFIYAILCEELGFLGAVSVVMLFGVFLWRGLLAGDRAPDDFGRYLAWGLTAYLSMQALLNISITIGLVPVTGMTLPFLSYGGSSLFVTLASCGLLLNISQHT